MQKPFSEFRRQSPKKFEKTIDKRFAVCYNIIRSENTWGVRRKAHMAE